MISVKVHIFWEGHKILWNLHRTFDCVYRSQIKGIDFAKFCGLLRIYELYIEKGDPNFRIRSILNEALSREQKKHKI